MRFIFDSCYFVFFIFSSAAEKGLLLQHDVAILLLCINHIHTCYCLKGSACVAMISFAFSNRVLYLIYVVCSQHPFI